MIAQEPLKQICPKCGYSKTVKPKSDVLNPEDFMIACPKCKAMMETKALSNIEKLFSKIRTFF